MSARTWDHPEHAETLRALAPRLMATPAETLWLREWLADHRHDVAARALVARAAWTHGLRATEGEAQTAIRALEHGHQGGLTTLCSQPHLLAAPGIDAPLDRWCSAMESPAAAQRPGEYAYHLGLIIEAAQGRRLLDAATMLLRHDAARLDHCLPAVEPWQVAGLTQTDLVPLLAHAPRAARLAVQRLVAHLPAPRRGPAPTR